MVDVGARDRAVPPTAARQERPGRRRCERGDAEQVGRPVAPDHDFLAAGAIEIGADRRRYVGRRRQQDITHDAAVDVAQFERAGPRRRDEFIVAVAVDVYRRQRTRRHRERAYLPQGSAAKKLRVAPGVGKETSGDALAQHRLDGPEAAAAGELHGARGTVHDETGNGGNHDLQRGVEIQLQRTRLFRVLRQAPTKGQ